MEVKLKFFGADSFADNLKAAIHITGRLGFSESAIKHLGINTDKNALIGKNEADNADENLYMVVQDSAQGDGFKFIKAGNYFYLNTKALFDNLGYEYRKKKIRFDIVSSEYEGKTVYKLIKKEDRERTK